MSFLETLGDVVATNSDRLDPMLNDRSGDHVQTAVRLAAQFEIVVVPRGAWTGLTGGVNRGAGSVVLGVSEMSRIPKIIETGGYAVVELEVIDTELNRRLKPYGVWFAPAPVSRTAWGC